MRWCKIELCKVYWLWLWGWASLSSSHCMHDWVLPCSTQPGLVCSYWFRPTGKLSDMDHLTIDREALLVTVTSLLQEDVLHLIARERAPKTASSSKLHIIEQKHTKTPVSNSVRSGFVQPGCWYGLYFEIFSCLAKWFASIVIVM